MNNCSTCKHALFNPVWGEYKCSKTGLVVYDISTNENCKDYEKGEPGMSKDIPEAK